MSRLRASITALAIAFTAYGVGPASALFPSSRPVFTAGPMIKSSNPVLTPANPAATRTTIDNEQAAALFQSKNVQAEGPYTAVSVVAGPFDIHRRYKSMEGPWVNLPARLGDLFASKQVEIPEAMVQFVEGNSQGGPSMGASMNAPIDTQAAANSGIRGLVETSGLKKELYWFKGIKLEVLDENDKPLPTDEFICHFNLDVDVEARNRLFPEGDRNNNTRIISITQGQTEMMLPQGFAIPVSSTEKWDLVFQAANRTSDQHRRVKHRCTMLFIKDSDLVYPIKAMNWYTPYITVVTDKDTPEAAEAEHKQGPSCLVSSAGVSAPNSKGASLFTDTFGRKVTGHWVVPPGKSSYHTAIIEDRDPGFAKKDRKIHFVWTHIHPCCTSASLVECGSSKPVLDVKIQTKTDGGLEIQHIDTISSEEGITLKGKRHYEVEADYDNVTGQPLDSMVTMGILYEDNTFARPHWATGEPETAVNEATVAKVSDKKNKAEALYCGIKSVDHKKKNEDADWTREFPLFNAKTDGPLLTTPQKMELQTSAGSIHITLDPTLAPIHATQLHNLLKKGVFNGTPFSRYEPNFVIQTALAVTKTDGQELSPELRKSIRRLPLEVDTQPDEVVSHKEWVLTMARDDQPTNSATCSFSILVKDAPHLDHKYTVFGHVTADDTTRQTINRIEKGWDTDHPWIISAQDIN